MHAAETNAILQKLEGRTDTNRTIVGVHDHFVEVHLLILEEPESCEWMH